MFVSTFNSIGNVHIVLSLFIIGANLDQISKQSFDISFSMLDIIVHLIIKCLVLPYCGLVYSYIIRGATNNRAILFTSFIQWFLPTSFELLIICRAKSVSFYGMSRSILVQWIFMIFINNLIIAYPFIYSMGLL